MKHKILLPEAPPLVPPGGGVQNSPAAPIQADAQEPPTPAVEKAQQIAAVEITPDASKRYAPPSPITRGNQDPLVEQPSPRGLSQQEHPGRPETQERVEPAQSKQGNPPSNKPADVPPPKDRAEGFAWTMLIMTCVFIGALLYFVTSSMEPAWRPNTNTESPSRVWGEQQIYSPRHENSPPEAPPLQPSSSVASSVLVQNANDNQTPGPTVKAVPAQEPPPKPAPPKESATNKPSPSENIVKKDGFQELLRSAEAGDLSAQSQLAHQYSTGKGTKVNYEEAFRWNLLAAKRGSSRAQSNLGVAYANGYAVERDIIEGYAWWYIASQSGSAHARSNMQKYETVLTTKQKFQAIARAKVLSKRIGN
ncbi:hypothetical protein [Prosthecobacter sp.]|uniref:hypothetical protein n=1 Tax=Prosthecobacter sp. TaxID=1965333 RepID=UPI003782DFF0